MNQSANADRCGKCIYGVNWGIGWYCDYLSITGHPRPCKFADCKLYRKHPRKEEKSK